MLSAEASRLFKSMCHLQDAKIFLVPPHDLYSDGKSSRREARGYRCRRVTRGGDVPARFHPVDIVVELHRPNLGWVRCVYVEGRHLRSGKNEVFVLIEESLKTPPQHR